MINYLKLASPAGKYVSARGVSILQSELDNIDISTCAPTNTEHRAPVAQLVEHRAQPGGREFNSGRTNTQGL